MVASNSFVVIVIIVFVLISLYLAFASETEAMAYLETIRNGMLKPKGAGHYWRLFKPKANLEYIAESLRGVGP